MERLETWRHVVAGGEAARPPLSQLCHQLLTQHMSAAVIPLSGLVLGLSGI